MLKLYLLPLVNTDSLAIIILIYYSIIIASGVSVLLVFSSVVLIIRVH